MPFVDMFKNELINNRCKIGWNLYKMRQSWQFKKSMKLLRINNFIYAEATSNDLSKLLGIFLDYFFILTI